MSAPRRRGRRLAPLILVVGLGGFFWLQSRHAAVDVEATYVLSGVRAGVESMSVLWEGEDGKTVDAVFNYHSRKVPRLEHQTLQLPRDMYDVTITLSYGDHTVRVVERQVEIESEGAVEIVVDAP